MFSLRLCCPFCGYGPRVLSITVLITMMCASAAAFNDLNIIPVVLAAGILSPIAGFIWCNRLTKLDRAWMEAAELPLWRPLTDEEKLLMKEKTVFRPWMFAFAYMIIITIAICQSMPEISQEFVPISAIVVMLIAVTAIMIWDYIRSRHWSDSGDEAVCTEVSVHRRYEITHYSRGGSYTTQHLVIYLPDGKYVLENNVPRCETVKIIKYGGMAAYFEVEPPIYGYEDKIEEE